jgi:hypothetical protein
MDRTAMNKLGDFEMEQKSSTRTQLDESRLLHDKVAAIFGAGGAIGSQVAQLLLIVMTFFIYRLIVHLCNFCTN